MAFDTFHPFAQLPRELRRMIWGFALKPKQPGAHFFTLFDTTKESERSRVPEEALMTCKGRSVTNDLAAPRCNKSDPQNFSWTESNPSAYLLDQGLWTACKESREVMEKRHPVTEDTLDEVKPRQLPDCAMAGSFSSNGEFQYFTVYPRSDLFCFQPLDLGFGDWEHCSGRFPLFLYGGQNYVRHIALEFDPSCLGPEGCDDDVPSFYDHPWVKCAKAVSGIELSWTDNLWLIDYRIKRRPSESPITQKREEFYGNGRTYVEVRPDDPGWQFGPGHEEQDYDNIFNFVEFLESDRVSADRWLDAFVLRLNQPEIRVLACEELDQGLHEDLKWLRI
ncbi:Fc.00g101740.m01.CDS01 [Cosmosporella sp. VM-42]